MLQRGATRWAIVLRRSNSLILKGSSEQAGARENALRRLSLFARQCLVGALDAGERQILRCVVSGMSSRGIAAAKEIGLAQVEDFRRSMMGKLLARTTADAVRIGLLAEVDRAN